MTAPTVRGTVAKQQKATPAEIAVQGMRDKITTHLGWFENVVPSHIDAKWFTSLCLGAINRGSDELVKALIDAPDTFLWAASECARLGLVPGETYHFVPFKSNTKGGIYEVTGMRDYKGEIELIYRSGGVISVHYSAIRARDKFRWHPNEMELPLHVIAGQDIPEQHKHLFPEGYEQEGLAGGRAERGPLTGAYAFAKLVGGGYSQPAVLGRYQIDRRRSSAKSKKWWGPEWPAEGRDTEKMWIKSAVHELYPGVPKSTEYVTERLRVLATPVMPALEGKAAPALEYDDEPDAIGGTPADGVTLVPGTAEDATPERKAAINRLFGLFHVHRLDDADARRAVVTGLLGADELADLGAMDAERISYAADLLERWIAELAPGTDVAVALAGYGSVVVRRIAERSQ